jgi:hypothetical protein
MRVLKNSSTAMTSLRTRTGKPSAACRPTRAAIAARGSFSSAATSGIHTARRPPRRVPETHTAVNVSVPARRLEVADVDSRACHASTKRKTPDVASTRQMPACTQPSDAPRRREEAGDASSSSRIPRGCGWSRAARRAAAPFASAPYTSIATPIRRTGRPLSSFIAFPCTAIQRAPPSAASTRVSIS